MKISAPLLLFLVFSILSVEAVNIKNTIHQDSTDADIYLKWNDSEDRDSVLHVVSKGKIESAGRTIYSEDEYIKHLPLVKKLPRYTESNAWEYRFLFSDSLRFKNNKKTVSAIVFQGTPVQKEFLDEIIHITLDAEYNVATTADIMPVYKGGYNVMINFLNENINFAKDISSEELSGEVILGFIVNKDGAITKVKVLDSTNDVLDREAFRLINSMPKWNAGIYKQSIPVFVTIQLIFKP